MSPSSITGAATVAAALAEAASALARAGCDTPRLDAELLLADALDADRAAILSHPRRELRPDAAQRFQALIERRSAREPVAYILGRQGFRLLDLSVDPRVLIPRPETELLVEAALALPPRARVIDMGSGCGAVALALKHERPDLDVMASDVSAEALRVTRANARRLGLQIATLQADLLVGVESPFDAVLANLPYVADDELDALAPEIACYEPREALAGGPDGLALIRSLIGQARDARFLALEVGAGQAQAVKAMLAGAGFAHVEALVDLAGIERVVSARRGSRREGNL